MTTSAFIFDATEQNFQQGVIENSYKAPVLVDFWAEWCEPCKQLIPILENLANNLNGQFVLAKVNSESEQSLSQQFQIRSIPSVLIFKNGEVVDQFTGLQPEDTIRQLIDKHSVTEADNLRNQAFEIIQSGDFDGGKALLLKAESLAPDNKTIQIDLAHLEAREKDYASAQKRLNKFSLADRENAQVISLLNKIELALVTENAPDISELEKILDETPDDHLSRYQLAIQLINKDNYETGLEHLIYILTRDNQFQNGAVKKSLLATFGLLGDEHPLVGKFRRKMFNAMH
ncbi:MAG: thioredoxin [Gammaproteobacteria bacterium]|nr:thioredoxin [Gammaproteobacteria bacterium]